MSYYPTQFIRSARTLRSKGCTYSEIQGKLHKKIPKGTLSSWFREVKLPASYMDKSRRLNLDVLVRARRKAVKVKDQRRRVYLDDLRKSNKGLGKILKQKEVSKLFLAALYLGEGAKKNRGSLTFANSDPGIISIFLRLLRDVYHINESKFRCTVLCRADQNPNQLNKFWSKITLIPKEQFYKARVDSRTLGKTTKNKKYKGVCRIDLFSASIYNELKIIGDLAISGPIV